MIAEEPSLREAQVIRKFVFVLLGTISGKFGWQRGRTALRYGEMIKDSYSK